MNTPNLNILTLTRSMASTVLLMAVIVFILDGCNRAPAPSEEPVDFPVTPGQKTVVVPVEPAESIVTPTALEAPVVSDDVTVESIQPNHNVPISSTRLLPTLDVVSQLTPAEPATIATSTPRVDRVAEIVKPIVELDVIEAVTATHVDRGARTPNNITAQFTAESDHAWAFVKVRNKTAPTHITMVWKNGNRIVSRKQLTVGVSPRWRTWSRLSLRGKPAGQWSVEVRSADDRLLQRLPFEVSTTTTASMDSAADRSGS